MIRTVTACGAAALVITAAVLAGEAEKLETAEALYQAGKWRQSREAFEQVLPELEGGGKAQALRRIGYCLERENRSEEAIPVYRKVLELEGIGAEHVAGAYLRLGYALRMVDRGREAIEVLERAAETKGAPANHVAEALLYAAWEHNTRGETEPALEKFRRIERIEDVHANYIATAYLSIGRILQEQDKYEEAIEVYGQIAGLNPVAATNRARSAVYIKECEALLAGDTPFHIKPYVSKVSGRSAKVFWVSQGEIPAGKVILGEGGEAREIEPEVRPIKDTICHLHVAEVEGLQPGRRYGYAVACGGERVEASFRTAPEGETPFSFCVIGDTQSYHKLLQPLLENMAREDAEFILHVGDITDRGNLWGEWKASFFDPGWSYLKESVFWPVYGNHDGGPYFPTLFERPQYWYSFDWGHAHFIVLDSYGAGSGGRGRQEQLAWLKRDLEANRRPWTIVALHVPMVATRRSLKWFGEEDFLPLLEEHEVDIVFSGHHPHYRRYRPIGKPGKKPILHITSGGGGGPVGGRMPSPVLSQGIDVNHYCKVEIDGNRLRLTARAISGAVIDRFELVKDQGSYQGEFMQAAVETGRAKEVISLYQELLTDRTHELRLSVAGKPEPGGDVELVLDLSRLPRGPLDPEKLPSDAELEVSSTGESAWRIAAQTFRLADGKGRFRATAPEDVSSAGGEVQPVAKVRLQLRVDGRLLEPVETTARLSVAQ